MTKILVKYLKGFDLYVPGDVRAVSIYEYRQLKKAKIVERTKILEDILIDNAEARELTGKNILGKEYSKGLIDVVVVTKNTDNIKSIKELAEAQKSGAISLSIVIANFSEQAKGFARCCNDGAELYEKLGEFVLLLNDDVILGDNFFDDIIKPFADEKVGIVGAECSQTSFGINGSVMCVRRELFEMVGGFDESYFFMFEDNDLCRSIQARGYKLATSQANAIHEGKESVNIVSEFWRSNYYKGLARFDKKWHNSNRVIGSMIVGNEANRYMTEVIVDIFQRGLIDELVVVCDKSDEDTVKELQGLARFYQIDIKYHDFKLFGVAENVLRERALDYVISKNPLGVIPIDADEILDEELTRAVIDDLLVNGISYDLVIAHFWGNKKQVRVDGVFSQQNNVRLFRYCPSKSQKFFDRNLHCGSGPIYTYENRKKTDYILKHYGYIRQSDILAKKVRQENFDKKMLLENPELYTKMMSEGDVIDWNKKQFLDLHRL